MSSFSQFTGNVGIRPIANINRQLPTISAGSPNSADGATIVAIPANSGIGGADTLQTVLSVTGKGALSFFGIQTTNTTSRILRVKITLDGVVVYDSTNTAGVTTGRWAVAHGSSGVANGYPLVEGTPLIYNASLLCEVASNLSDAASWANAGYVNYLR